MGLWETLSVPIIVCLLYLVVLMVDKIYREGKKINETITRQRKKNRR